MVYLFVALASLFSRSMNCVVTAWKMSTASHAHIVIVIRVPTHLKSQGKSGNFFGQGKSGNFVGSQGKLAMIIHVAQVLSSVVVTDQLRHTRSFIGAYSSKSTLWVIVLVFLKIMAMERSRCRGGGADYKLHKTSSSICIGSGNSSKHSQGI